MINAASVVGVRWLVATTVRRVLRRCVYTMCAWTWRHKKKAGAPRQQADAANTTKGIPVAVDEVAGEGGVVKRKVPRPAGAALVVVEHHPAEALDVRLEQPLPPAAALDVLQLALVLVVPVLPPVLPQPHLRFSDWQK